MAELRTPMTDSSVRLDRSELAIDRKRIVGVRRGQAMIVVWGSFTFRDDIPLRQSRTFAEIRQASCQSLRVGTIGMFPGPPAGCWCLGSFSVAWNRTGLNRAVLCS